MKYVNLVKVHIESVPSNSILGIPGQKLKQENTFKFGSSNWYWTVRNGGFRNLHPHCIIETCKFFWVI